MHALTIIPRTPNSLRASELPEPPPSSGAVLVRTHAIGICGTDLELVQGSYGWASADGHRLVIGHESIGQVLEAPSDSGLRRDDWVVGMVRIPDPVPCTSCAVGEWDMCRNGLYKEHGIKQLDGFGAQRFRLAADRLVKVDDGLGELGVLLEPTSVVAKAWEQIERIGARSRFEPRRVLVTGAGPIGLLAALLGVQRNLEVHVLDRIERGPKPALVRELGAKYHAKGLKQIGPEWDIIIECTGAPGLWFDVIEAAAPAGIVCLTGVSSGGRSVSIDPASVNREIVLQNNVIVGSVNANRRHYEQAASALARADRGWLSRLITRRERLTDFDRAFTRQPDDVKTTLLFD